MNALLLAPLLLAVQDTGTPGDTGGQEIPTRRGDEELPETMSAEEARRVLARGLAYLTDNQKEDGSWGSGANECIFESGFEVSTYYDWKLGAHAIACMALAASEETPERRAALEGAVDYLCTTRMPGRGSNWDVDYSWPALYGFVACVELVQDERFQGNERGEKLSERGRAFLDILLRNQAPDGGWAYYDDPPFTRRPTWATSFCTALVLPALEQAEELGWLTDPKVRARATRYVRRCALPGGAYEYDLRPVARLTGGEHINRIKGSLGRTQVCNWGLKSTGVDWVTADKIRGGLESFFEHHRFLDVAHMRPVPHEAYYANAGYFYFFAHYYAAKAINLLPVEERAGFHERLRPHLAKTQRRNGSSSDFLDSTYMFVASTSYLSLALIEGLAPTE